MINNELDIRKLATYCETHLDLANATFSNEYRYASLPLCVIDAVWSIGVRYAGVENVITHFCQALNVPRLRPDSDILPPINEQLSITDFLAIYDHRSFKDVANNIFQNHQRTSPRGGVLKAEAVYYFGKTLLDFGINYLQDVASILGNVPFEAAIKQIPGQRSGISINYFYMLVGSTTHIKPNRQIERFIAAALGRTPRQDEMFPLISAVYDILQPKYPHLNLRLLDHLIWRYQVGKADDEN